VLFAPLFLFRLGSQVLVEAEPELGFEEDELAVELEYAQINWTVAPGFTVVSGLFLMPLGIWRERLHPIWIDRSVDPPYPYQRGGHHGAALPSSGFGIQGRASVAAGPHASVNGSAFACNGPGERDGEMVIGGMIPDNNRNPYVGGRVGLLPVRELEIGLSAATGLWDDDASHRTTALVADVMARRGGVVVQGEIIGTWTEEREDETVWRTYWWPLVAWRPLQAPAPLSRFELVGRYGGASTPGARTEADHEAPSEEEEGFPPGFSHQIGGGLNYYVRPSVALRVGGHLTLPSEDTWIGVSFAAGL
jgi:hypothetical protein